LEKSGSLPPQALSFEQNMQEAMFVGPKLPGQTDEKLFCRKYNDLDES
jgi:hypothetical protein